MRSGLWLAFSIIIMTLSANFQIDPGADHAEGAHFPIHDRIFTAMNSLSSSPFIENGGQWDPSILYVISTKYGKMALAKDGIYHWVHKLERRETDPIEDAPEFEMIDSCLIKALFEGGSPASVRGEDPVQTRYNFFLGNDSRKWATEVRGYRKVTYNEVWPGIDLTFFSRKDDIEFKIVHSPGCDPGIVRFDIEGSEHLKKMNNPSIAQHIIGMYLNSCETGADPDVEKEKISKMDYKGADQALYNGTRSGSIYASYNVNALNYSTFIGGSGGDRAFKMDIDKNGNIYIGGVTDSMDFPLNNSFMDRFAGGWDVIIFKIDRAGKSCLYATYIGGSSYDIGSDIRVDTSGNVFVTGYTNSEDFPVTPGCFDDTVSQNDLFILKLSDSGSDLLYSTYLGGSGNDYVYIQYGPSISYNIPRLDIYGDDIVYIASATTSKDFPVTGDAYQTSLMGDSNTSDIILVKMDLSTMELLYSTYLGGVGDDYSTSIVVKDDRAYVAGVTLSDDFNVTSGAYQTAPRDSWNAFVLKFDLGSKKLVYSTYYGGSDIDNIWDIFVDDLGNVYACGHTYSADLPVSSNAYGSVINGSVDGFVVGLNSDGSGLFFSSYIGGRGGFEWLTAIFLDNDSNLHVAGFEREGEGFDFPTTPGALQEESGLGHDKIIYMKLNPDASVSSYSTFLGGGGNNFGHDLLIDPSDGETIILGWTNSNHFPIKEGSFDTTYNGGGDITLTKFELSLTPGEPRDLEAVAGDSCVRLNWDPPLKDGGAPVTFYQIWRGNSSGDLNENLGLVQELNYNDTNITNGIIYYYSVRALNRIGFGRFSNEVDARPMTIPSPPRDLKIVSTGNRTVELEWISPEYTGGVDVEILGYNIYRTSEGSEPTKIEMEGPTTFYVYEGVENGIEQTYFVTAVNVIGESLPSISASATPMTIPGAVSDLRAESGDGVVHLYWSAPLDDGGSPVLGYIISKRYGSRNISYSIGPRTEYEDIDVQNGRTYYYSVVPRNTNGLGIVSDEVIGEPMRRPSPPHDVMIAVRSNSIILSWNTSLDDGGSDIIEYLVYRRDDSWTIIDIVPADQWSHDGIDPNLTYGKEHSFRDSNLEFGKEYSYRITARNRAGESDPSGILSAIPLNHPGIVSELSLLAGNGFVYIMWKEPISDGGSQVLGYIILKGENDTAMDTLAILPSNEHSYNDTSVRNGKTYFYRVIAFNAIGSGPQSSVESVRPVGLPYPPASMRLTSGDSYVEITWSETDDDGGLPVKYVKLYRWVGFNVTTVVMEAKKHDGSFNDTSVENGLEYSYALSSMNDLGEGPLSEPRNATPLGKPSQPQNLRIRALSRSSVKLTWDAPEKIGGAPILIYNIYRSEDDFHWSWMGNVSGDICEYRDEWVRVGRTYQYKVTAMNVVGEGPPSEQRSVDIEGWTGDLPRIMISLIVLAAIVILSAIAIAIKKRRKRPLPIPWIVVEPPKDQGGEDPIKENVEIPMYNNTSPEK